jgi:soluble lytic murein transglycosylase
MSKALKNTIAIIIILAVSVSLGYFYDKIKTEIEKQSHPLTYGEFVDKYSEKYSVPPYIIYSVIKAESGFDSAAKSSAGAVGLMQIMPETYKDIAARMIGETANEGLLYDPETNIKYGTYYLRYLYDKFESWDLAFAAYNAGPARITVWLSNPEYITENEIVYIPIEETRNYLQKVQKNIESYKRLYFS